MPETITAAIDHTGKLGMLWCALMHDSPMWPIHGEYQCRTCGRRHPVPWDAKHFVDAPVPRAAVPSFRSALLPLVVFLALLSVPRVRAADLPLVISSAPAAMAFAR